MPGCPDGRGTLPTLALDARRRTPTCAVSSVSDPCGVVVSPVPSPWRRGPITNCPQERAFWSRTSLLNDSTCATPEGMPCCRWECRLAASSRSQSIASSVQVSAVDVDTRALSYGESLDTFSVRYALLHLDHHILLSSPSSISLSTQLPDSQYLKFMAD